MGVKFSFITIIAVLTSIFQLEILAQTATKTETDVLAESLGTKSFFNPKVSKGVQVKTIEKIDSVVYDGITIGYVYHYVPSGYALIPKFKEINPFFAFSGNGKINPDKDNFIYSFLRDELILRFRALKDDKIQKEILVKNTLEWGKYLGKGLETEYPLQIPADGTTSTGGLIETKWGQDGIYNDFCPTDPKTNNKCLTGCSATAMAQIVNYWGNLTGTPTTINFTSSDDYTSTYVPSPDDGYGTRIISIDATTASVSNITYPLSDQNIGRLNFACGVSLKANYSSVGTSALPSAGSFINKFGFVNARKLEYDNTFTDVLYHNIEKGMPCLLSISKPNAAHAIVCDGLKDDGLTVMFHLNYGWNGTFAEPGFYYEIPSNLPDSYTTINSGIVDITAEVPDLIIAEGTLSISKTSVQPGLNLTAYCAENNLGAGSAGANVVSIHLSADNILTPGTNNDIYLGEINIPGVAANSCSIIYSKLVTIPSYISPGNYYIFFSADGGQVIKEVFENNNFASIPLTVTASCTSPATQTTAFTTSAITNTSVTVGWTRGNGDAVLVVAHQGGSVNEDPAGGVTYSASSTFGSGTQIGTGNFVVYNGTAASVVLTALTPGTTYHFNIYEYSFGTNCYKIPSLTGNSTTSSSGVTTIDFDGNVYSTVTIGSQVWIAENLKTTKYNDGTDIPLITLSTDWAALSTPGFSWYNNDPDTYKPIYGALYNWYSIESASNGGRNVCPAGWHVPTDAQWTILTDYLTNNGFGYGGSGNDIAKSLASSTGWSSWITAGTVGFDQSVNNSSGFSAFPGGSCDMVYGGNTVFSGTNGYWWSVSESSALNSWSRSLSYMGSGISRNEHTKKYGFSVRCLKNSEPYIDIPALSTQSINDITLFTANTGGNISSDGGAPITARGVCWSTSPEPIIANNKTTESLGTGLFTSSLTDLVANTTYYVKAYATNSAGTGYGNLIIFKTKGGQEGTVTDVEGNIYKTITIGTQIWMAENLRTTSYNDYTSIPYCQNVFDWVSLSTPGYCWYDEVARTYGALYNWYSIDPASNGGKNVCPTGWSVPGDYQWTLLTDYLTDNRYGYEGSGDDIAKSMASTLDWNSWITIGTIGYDLSGNNISGFTALPGGNRSNGTGVERMFGYWWSDTESAAATAWARSLGYNSSFVARDEHSKKSGLSIRCIFEDLPLGYDNTPADEISIYPNPVAGMLNLKYKNDNIMTISIINSSGMLIRKEKAVTPIQQLDFTSYKAGLYILEFLKSSGGIMRIKVLKSN